MKIRNIKNFDKHFIEVTASIPDEAPVELHEEFAKRIEQMMQELRGTEIEVVGGTVDIEDVLEILDNHKYSMGDKLTEEVLQMNIDDWKNQIKEKANESKKPGESQEDNGTGEVL